MIKRAMPGDTPCVGVWPITGKPCKNLPCDGQDTCEAHDPAGDRRAPAPPEEFRCTGTNRESGERCRRTHAKGGKACRFHGGNGANARKGAKARLIEEKAARLVHTYGRKIETTATQALLDEVQWTAGHVEWLRERVQQLEEAHAFSIEDPDGTTRGNGGRHPLVWGITRIKEGGEDYGVTEEAAPSVWLQMYWRERDHLVKVCAATVKAGIDERMVKLAEDQGKLVADVIRAVLGDLDLSVEQQARVHEIVPRHLRALTA